MAFSLFIVDRIRKMGGSMPVGTNRAKNSETTRHDRGQPLERLVGPDDLMVLCHSSRQESCLKHTPLNWQDGCKSLAKS